MLEDAGLMAEDRRIFAAIARNPEDGASLANRHALSTPRHRARVEPRRPPARAAPGTPASPVAATSQVNSKQTERTGDGNDAVESTAASRRCARPLDGSACGGDKAPSAPTTTTAARLTAPVGETPSADEQLETLRPMLTVKNGTSDQATGAGPTSSRCRTTARSAAPYRLHSSPAGFAVMVGKTGVPENAAGKTSFQPDQDLQPTTRYYWRARVVQGTGQSDWSAVSTFKTKLVGYSRAGELYDR